MAQHYYTQITNRGNIWENIVADKWYYDYSFLTQLIDKNQPVRQVGKLNCNVPFGIYCYTNYIYQYIPNIYI